MIGTEVLWWEVDLDAHVEDEKRISPSVRNAVYRRDRYRCRKCGTEHFEGITLHHVIFRSQLGGHGVDNLISLCWHCHRRVHDGELGVIRSNGRWYFIDYRRVRSVNIYRARKLRILRRQEPLKRLRQGIDGFLTKRQRLRRRMQSKRP